MALEGLISLRIWPLAAVEMNARQRSVNSIERKHNDLQQKRRERQDRKIHMTSFLAAFRRKDGLLTEYDEGIWNSLIESVKVLDEKRPTFRFKCGNEVQW